MPEEIGMETCRSDAPSADESPFVDAEDEATAEVAEEQAVGKETAQESQDPEDLKVVVSIKGGRATIGVQGASSDPHIESFDDLDEFGADTGGLGGDRKGEGEVGRRAQAPGPRETRSPGQASAPARAGVGAGFNRRGRGRPAATRDG